MHASSIENMQRCYEQYVGRSNLLKKECIRVVDIGGADVNGSYADIFSHTQFEYIAVDLEAKEGVDVVLEDPYKLPFGDSSVDIVISGQVFEHVDFFWDLFREMCRIVHSSGLVLLIVPSAGPIHRYPVDCYRFYPDSMDALARYAGISLLDCWLDKRGPWNDLVGIFSHRFEASETMVGDLPANRYIESNAPAALMECGGTDEENRISGKKHYLELLKQLHLDLEPRFYLEIGVRNGTSLALCDSEAAGVDPQPDLSVEGAERHALYQMSSDRFFESSAKAALAGKKLDLVFIDGMHLFEFALRDFINVEQNSLPTTLVVIDDIFPNHRVQAERNRASKVWTGDVWKLYHCLKHNRPDLLLVAVDTAPTGMLLVAGLDRGNQTLLQRYNPLVRQYGELGLDDWRGPILQRQGARSPDDRMLKDLSRHLRVEREKYQVGNAADSVTRQILRIFRQ